MSKVKSIISGGFEVLKDSAKQITGTVAPGKLIEQAIGPKTQTNEFSNYLKKLGPDMTSEELETKKKKLESTDQKKLEEERKKLQIVTTPAHMRSAEKPKQPRSYELAIQEEEQKKAMAVEAQKKHPQPMTTPSGKQPRGMLGARRRPKASDFEAGKNIKIG